MSLAKTLILVALLFTGVLHAESASRLQVGGSYTRVTLNVDDEPSFHGNLGGAQGIYEYQSCNGFYAAIKAASKIGSTENASTTRYLTYADAQERLGYTFARCSAFDGLTLFTGFGYHYMRHKLTPAIGSVVKFNYNEFYVPLGFLAKYCFSCCSVGLNVTWMPQVFSSVEITPLAGANWSLENTYGNVQVEVPLICHFCNCFSLVFNPFYEHWEDGRSTAVSASGQELGLPNNTYHFWGFELSLGYSF